MTKIRITLQHMLRGSNAKQGLTWQGIHEHMSACMHATHVEWLVEACRHKEGEHMELVKA